MNIYIIENVRKKRFVALYMQAVIRYNRDVNFSIYN